MFKNISLSFGINIVNLLFPLFLIPFYIKTFGIENYGLIAISMALINLISVIYDYSWYAFAPIEIKKIGDNSNLLNQYISKVITTKVYIFIPTLLFLGAFIGMNKVNIYFIINTVVKITCIVLIIVTLSKQEDYQYVFYYLGITDIFLFLLSTLYLITKCRFRYKVSNLSEVYNELKLGFKLFLTNVTICALLNSSTLILGLFLDNATVGIYNVAEKIIMLCKQSISVLFQGVYYKACSIGIDNTTQLNRFLKLIFILYLGIYGLGAIFILFIPSQLIQIFSYTATAESSKYLIMLAPLPLIAALNQSAYISLILHHKKNSYFYSHLFGLLLNILLATVLCYFFAVYGIIIALILTEVFITLYLNFSIVYNKKLNFFKPQID